MDTPSPPRRSYIFKTEPYSHQRAALERCLASEAFALLMEMGTGKTKVAIDDMGTLWCDDQIDAAVVLAPKGVYLNWTRRELPVHMDVEVMGNARVLEWHGRWRETQAGPGLLIAVMNIEALSAGRKAVAALGEILRGRRVAMYVDESTFIKSPSARRTKNVLVAGRGAARRRIMTGSPVTRSPLDLWSQFEFLRPQALGTQSYYAFRARYAIMATQYYGGRAVQQVVDYQNLDDLSERVGRMSFRVTKAECLDLPEKVYVQREVELTPEQRAAYASMREQAQAQIGDDWVSATEVITQMMRLHQIVCGHVPSETGEMIDVPSRRIDVLREICEEAGEQKVVVWSRYRHTIPRIVEALGGPAAVVEYHGGVGTREREEGLQRFRLDPQCRFFVGTAAAGGYGITLTEASVVVYFSNDYSLEARAQSEDRCHRVGQTRSVTYIDLVAPRTVDELILRALREKRDLAEMIMRDRTGGWLA